MEYGIGVILNCSLTSSLQEALCEQVLASVMLYVDPDVSSIKRVIDAMIIMENINPEHQPCDYYYPEYLFLP